MTTPDPTPALLPSAPACSAADLARAIEHARRITASGAADDGTLLSRALLTVAGHLAALQAPAPEDGGEALGLAIFAASDMQAGESAENTTAEWARLLPDARAEMIRQGIALFARGAVAMTGEDDPAVKGAILILMERHDDELHEAHARGRAEGEAERGQLQAIIDGEREGYRELLAKRDAEVVALKRREDATNERARLSGVNEERERWQGVFAANPDLRIVAPRDTAGIEAEAAKRGDPWTIEIVGRLCYTVAATFQAWSEENDARCEGESEWAREQVTKEREACAAVARRVPATVDPAGVGEAIALAIEHRTEGRQG